MTTEQYKFSDIVQNQKAAQSFTGLQNNRSKGSRLSQFQPILYYISYYIIRIPLFLPRVLLQWQSTLHANTTRKMHSKLHITVLL